MKTFVNIKEQRIAYLEKYQKDLERSGCEQWVVNCMVDMMEKHLILTRKACP